VISYHHRRGLGGKFWILGGDFSENNREEEEEEEEEKKRSRDAYMQTVDGETDRHRIDNRC